MGVGILSLFDILLMKKTNDNQIYQLIKDFQTEEAMVVLNTVRG